MPEWLSEWSRGERFPRQASGCRSGERNTIIVSDRTCRLLRPFPWQLEFLFKLGAVGWVLHGGVVTLTTAVQDWPALTKAAWSGSMIALSAAMFVICILGRRSTRLEAFGYGHTVFTGFVAIGWATGAFLAIGHGYEDLLFFTLALGGTALGAVAAQHSVLRSCLVSVWLSVPGLALAHLLATEGKRGDANALMIGLFAVVLSLLAVKMNRALCANRELSDQLAAKVEETEAERQTAHHASRAKSRFLAYISHDLRQPVHAVGLQIEALKGYRFDGEPKQIIDQIDITIRSLAQLFQSLLDMSAIEIDRLRPRPETFDAGAVLRSVAEQHRLAIELTGGRLRIFAPRTVFVRSDRALLANILQNLIGNAAKHAPGCRISVGVRTSGGEVSLLVLDRGRGIDPSMRARIFEDFESGDVSGTATAQKSFGLGLPLALRLTSLLGLVLRDRSWPGRGTMFVLTGLQEAEPVKDTLASMAVHPLNALRVAVFDDDKPTLSATARLLAGWGCEVTSFDLTRATPPAHADVLITDYRFGNEQTSRPMIEAALRMPTEERPGIVLVTGVERAEYADLLTHPGLLALHKPAHPAQLRACLTTLAMRDQKPSSLPLAAAAARVETPSALNTNET